MADQQQIAHVNMNSSQGTYVATRETRPPPSAQDAEQGSIDRSDNHAGYLVVEKPNESLSSNVRANEHDSSFTEILQQYQQRLNGDFDEYEQKLAQDNPEKGDIPAFDWDALEYEYQKEVGEIAMKEKEIMSQFDARFKVFEDFHVMDFTNVLSNSCCGCRFQMSAKVNEQSRGTVRLTVSSSHTDSPRLKTQSALVQHSETELAQKEQHCE